MRKIIVTTILVCAAQVAISGEGPARSLNTAPDGRTPEAVEAADAAWLDAEINGDYKFLTWFLADGYESIDASGSIFSRAALIENRRKRGKSEEFAKAVKEWRASHPSHAEVRFFGDSAVLTWVADDPNSKTPVFSSDIFVYRSHHWHAIYSQHSTAES